MPKFEYRASIEEARGWQLYKKSLDWELVDRAEAAARNKHGPAFDELEVETSITVDGEDLLVTFTWGDENALSATRRVMMSKHSSTSTSTSTATPSSKTASPKACGCSSGTCRSPATTPSKPTG